MAIIRRLRARWKLWKDRRFLAANGCLTWSGYYRKIDPDHNPRANRVSDFYHGYPYVFCFENHKHDIYDWSIHTDGVRSVYEWCDCHMQNKYRMDCLRVYQQTALDWNRNETPEWVISDLGGTGDYMFVGFKDERDALIFTLKWAG